MARNPNIFETKGLNPVGRGPRGFNPIKQHIYERIQFAENALSDRTKAINDLFGPKIKKANKEKKVAKTALSDRTKAINDLFGPKITAAENASDFQTVNKLQIEKQKALWQAESSVKAKQEAANKLKIEKQKALWQAESSTQAHQERLIGNLERVELQQWEYRQRIKMSVINSVIHGVSSGTSGLAGAAGRVYSFRA